MTKMRSGRFCWHELLTTDPAKSLTFLEALLGVKGKGSQHAPDEYTELYAGESPFGGLMATPDPAIPSCWLGYILVKDLARDTERARELGAEVPMANQEIPRVGRFSMLRDPQGAVFYLYQSQDEMPEGQVAPGTVCWSELHSPNLEGSTAFYTQLLGWKHKALPLAGFHYTMFEQEGKDVAGMMAAQGGTPPFWLHYFLVQNTDLTCEKALELGARVMAPPSDVPNMGRMAVLADPTGAVFALWAPVTAGVSQ